MGNGPTDSVHTSVRSTDYMRTTVRSTPYGTCKCLWFDGGVDSRVHRLCAIEKGLFHRPSFLFYRKSCFCEVIRNLVFSGPIPIFIRPGTSTACCGRCLRGLIHTWVLRTGHAWSPGSLSSTPQSAETGHVAAMLDKSAHRTSEQISRLCLFLGPDKTNLHNAF